MIDRIVTFAVERRWIILILTALAAIVGTVALARLPIDAVPDITNNQVQVNIVAPALSPELIEKQVAFPIETALAGIRGLEGTRSLSRNGFAQITAIFSDRTDIYFARAQVAERLTAAQPTLPAGVIPEMGPIATGLGEVYIWTLRYAERGHDAHRPGEPGLQPDGSYITPEGDRLTREADKATWLHTVQDWIVAPQIRTVPGVAGIDSLGGFEKEYLVVPDTARLAGIGLSLGDLATALERANVASGGGTVDRNGEGLAVRIDARIRTLAQLRGTVIATREVVPIRLDAVATARIGQGMRMGAASEGGKEVITGTAIMRIGENSRTVSTGVDARLKAIGPSLPPDIVIEPVLDRSRLVDATIATVARNLGEGALLVIVVLFALLGNVRAALIAAAVIPVTMLLTGFGMLQAGVSANLMSLGALDFGLIVDGAVIIVEHALRRIAERQQDEGAPLDRAARLAVVAEASREMIRPSLFGQAIIMIVYAPLLTLTGVEGRTFEPMALTVIMALGFAFILSLTFVPAAIALWLSRPVAEKEGRIVAWLRARYEPGLDHALHRPRTTIAMALAALAIGTLAFATLGQEFLPQLDEGDVLVSASRVPGTSVEQSQRMQFQIERALAGMPEIRTVFSRTGTAEVASDPMPPNATDTFIMLRPKREWPDPGEDKAALVARIEARLARVPGHAYEVTQPIRMRFNELIAGVRSDIAVKVFGDDFAEMNMTAARIAAVLARIEGAQDVKVEQTEGLPMLDIGFDRDAAARLGVSAQDVADTVAAAVGGRTAGMIFEGDRRFPVTIRLADTSRADFARIGQIPVRTPSGAFVPLASVASIGIADGPNQISRENGKRRVVVQANVRGRDIAGVVADARAAIAREVALPTGLYLTWGGQFENLASARDRLAIVLPACFALILLLLYGALGSLRDAAIVFTGVPLALVGGAIALALRGMPFSISAAVGFIALSGIAVLNGLVMLGAIQALVRAGQDRAAAARAGALARLRPVAMTALVASLGFVPMALGQGAGAEVQKPLATVVIGGLISATLLTLFVLPALFARYGSGGREPSSSF
jgi:cobalt-zinc-cadmium resistance protein CzcA